MRRALNRLCKTHDGQIVLVSKLWQYASKGESAISLYAFQGVKTKTAKLLRRSFFSRDTHSKDMLMGMRETVAHLWAMEYGVSDYVVIFNMDEHPNLYHPSELQQEKQP